MKLDSSDLPLKNISPIIKTSTRNFITNGLGLMTNWTWSLNSLWEVPKNKFLNCWFSTKENQT